MLNLSRYAGTLQNVVDFFLPQRCGVCGAFVDAPGQSFCASCLDGFAPIENPRCERCGVPFKSPVQGDHLCGDCLNGRWKFDRAVSVFFYRGPLRNAVHRLKYAGNVILAKPLSGFLLTKTQWALQQAPDILIPTPSRTSSLRRRGFNPPHLLARYASRAWNIPLSARALTFTRDIPSQAGLNRTERLRNVKGAFQADRDAVRGKRILLLDDVMTTGATVNECAKALKKAGAESVSALTLARVVEWDLNRS